MGTNFYWIQEHEGDTPECIGKRSWGGTATGSLFTWTQDPALVRSRCEQHPDRSLVKDEYGRELTGQDFLQKISECSLHITDSIGVDFE